MLYVDIPTLPELQTLIAARGSAHVSIYLPTTPESQHIETARKALGNLLREAEGQLKAADTPKRTIWPIEEQVNDLIDDDEFWQFQANSLAIFSTPDLIRTYRLPNHLTELVQVSDRFHLKPLIRSVSVPQHAFVLALTENEIRLIEFFADMPAREVRVPHMPTDAASAVGTASVNSRSASGRIQGSEGQKVRLRQFARKVDAALRPVLAGRQEPLILAATEPLLSIFRSVNSYPGLAEDIIETSPARITPAELADSARPIMDRRHSATLDELRGRIEARGKDGRATTDIAQTARAATFGAVETLLVNIDSVVSGTIDEATGAVTFDPESGPGSYGVVDEIAGRVLASGGQVIGVRKDDIPGGAELAAVLRYPV